jgi:bacteriocin-like protein
MANSNDPKNSGKKLNAAAAQKLREQLANKIAELSDDELSQVAGGTTVEVPTVIIAPTVITVPVISPTGAVVVMEATD